MEQNLKNCSVILEPVGESGISATQDIYENQNCLTPRHTKIVSGGRCGKNVTYGLSKTQQSLSPCYVILDKMNFQHNLETYDNANIGSSTPQGISKHKTALQEKELKIKLINGATPSATFPLTPKAHIEFSIELKKAINERNILTSKTKKRVFEALDEIKSKTEEERRGFKKEKALLEIVTSEIKYVHQLELIINFFMKPVKDRILLKSDDYDILFGNINTIYNVNKELLDELDKGVANVATAFSKIAPFLKLYSVYAYEFKSRLNILQNARLLNPQFAKFLENQETRPEVQNKLSALLIAPIQRVPRYKLLLTNLYNLTKPSEEGFDTLSDCLEKIEQVAEHVNKVVEDQENTQCLLEFQRCLRGEPNIIMPGRKLIKQGVLTKMSTKSTGSEKLYVVLMNDIIMFNKMKKDEPKVNSLKCSSIFPLNKCTVVEILDKGCLKIICQDEELILYHDQFSETKNWIKVIKVTVDDYLKDRKTLRKESSARRPVKRKDLHEYHEAGLSPGKPLKKRKIHLDKDSADSKLPSRRILKRKPIGAAPDELEHSKSLPCSFISPLPDSTNTIVNNKQINEQSSELAKDLYIFGKPNDDRGFKFGKFIGGVGSGIKKLLGFRN